ncbi:MAG: putative 2OG-Fe(II) oxygenase [Pirellulales bacterium]|nr:putative 2OG-Fe(II) oxygenase [Pirellulales bacterium]
MTADSINFTSGLQGVLQLPRGKTVAWHPQQPIQNLGDPRIFGTVFQDAPLFHPELVEYICRKAATVPRNKRAVGGRKVRDAETWNLPGMQLITWRVLQFYRQALNLSDAYVVDRWANVMVDRDYSTPHSHYDTESAVLYILDPGDEDLEEPMDGNFEIIDSRIPLCCPYQPERPIRGISPKLVPGMMIVFPAEYLHHVRPYSGRRPRITMAWNVNPGPMPPDFQYDATKQLEFKTDVMKGVPKMN